MLLLGMSFTTKADDPEQAPDIEEVGLYYDPVKTGHGGNPYPRMPMKTPKAYISGHTLLINGISSDYIVRLYDEDGNLVCSIPVWGGTGSDTVMLPSTLSGDYEVSIFVGSFCFSGYINL